jgi:hypothetical protein
MNSKETYFMVSSGILPLIMKNNISVTAAVNKGGSVAEYEQANKLATQCKQHVEDKT